MGKSFSNIQEGFENMEMTQEVTSDGKHVVEKGSWEKREESFKLKSLKLESFHLSLKVPIKVGKFSMQY